MMPPKLVQSIVKPASLDWQAAADGDLEGVPVRERVLKNHNIEILNDRLEQIFREICKR